MSRVEAARPMEAAETIEMKVLSLFGRPVARQGRQQDMVSALNTAKHLHVHPVKKAATSAVPQIYPELSPVWKGDADGHLGHNDVSVEIEMDTFPPPDRDLTRFLGIPSGPVESKEKRMKWHSSTAKKSGLFVKDVICLPYGSYQARDDLYYAPTRKEREQLALVGLVSRISIDCRWTSEEIQGRLAMLFQKHFCSSHDNFRFKYLQSVQGSCVLVEPETPKCSWTAGEVLNICKNNSLYILSLHNLLDEDESSP
ncbi:uncharacterized protein LOC114802162 isoform X2 [Denticeps clupeoides]|uniref:uncharacterized protein LOC114802162 isoform X2 n=1 Tax=Denticeps clupeoides TaxID=299321 RepID=UPI0010A50EB2|nr:uncharacterized protein LOC114802162 isoform X2 [Denticeps clupeoides]